MTLKRKTFQMLNSILFAGLLVSLPLILCLVIMLFGPMLTDFLQRRSFVSNAWKSAAWKTSVGQHDDIRVHMVDDLLYSHKLVGMTRGQLIELLGQPSTFESAQSPGEYIYYLGLERGFICIDNEWLAVKFLGDRVISATDRTD